MSNVNPERFEPLKHLSSAIINPPFESHLEPLPCHLIVSVVRAADIPPHDWLLRIINSALTSRVILVMSWHTIAVDEIG